MLCGQRGWIPAGSILDVPDLVTLEDGLDNLGIAPYAGNVMKPFTALGEL